MCKRCLVFLVLAVLAACSPDPGSKAGNPTNLNNGQANNGQNNGTDDAGNNGLADAQTEDVVIIPDLIMEPGGPEFINLSASPETLSEGQSTTVLVQVTDPDGFDDIGGGRLLAAGGEVIGNFQGSGGSYEFELSWNDINNVESIAFETTDTRVFIAEFFDAAGLVSQESLTLTLTCDGMPACEGRCGESLCGGACFTEFVTDENCGRCGNTCAQTQTCNDGSCLDRPATNYFEYCIEDIDCAAANNNATCFEIPGDPERRCAATCDQAVANDCGPGAICVMSTQIPIPFCVTDCTNAPNSCKDDLVCVTQGNQSGCAPAGFN